MARITHMAFHYGVDMGPVSFYRKIASALDRLARRLRDLTDTAEIQRDRLRTRARLHELRQDPAWFERHRKDVEASRNAREWVPLRDVASKIGLNPDATTLGR